MRGFDSDLERPICEVIEVQKQQEAKFLCSACGAERGCNCNAPAIPKAQQAIEALKANPEKSDRAIAADIGVAKNTVRAARQELVNTDQLEDGPRIGLDGKKRKQPRHVTVNDVHTEVRELKPAAEARNKKRVHPNVVYPAAAHGVTTGTGRRSACDSRTLRMMARSFLRLGSRPRSHPSSKVRS